jgi:hypothetical protein
LCYFNIKKYSKTQSSFVSNRIKTVWPRVINKL